MDLTKEIKNRQMANYVRVDVKTNDNLDFTKEIKKIKDNAKYFKEAKGEISFFTIEKVLELLLNEITEVTKNYPTEEFILEMAYETNSFHTNEIYKTKNGECNFYKTELSYEEEGKENIEVPLSEEDQEEPQDLLDEAIECFRKLDVDENGKLSLSRHKHTVEVEGDEYKLLVSKIGHTYKVEKVFSKVPTYTWEEIKHPLPF